MLMDMHAADDAYFEALRSAEFGRLDALGQAYLDFAASGLYARSQLQDYFELLSSGIFGNPHSDHRPSRLSSELIENARAAVLDHFGFEESTHTVCFTANTTAAAKLVGESYPFSRTRGLILTADNHNSINGIREFARAKKARVTTLPLGADMTLDAARDRLAAIDARDGGLLAYPAQSNFSGVRHPLGLVDRARALGYDVLLDAAGLSPFSLRELGSCSADYIAISFYKLFGLPTGLGALIARNEALARLGRPWFAGGTVDFVSIELDRHQLAGSAEGFEDGTPNFLGIAAVPIGFRTLQPIGTASAKRRLGALTDRLHAGLTSLRYPDGSPIIAIYGPADRNVRGATIAFNILDRSGQPLPYSPVERAARDAGIAVRGGCFCNPGAAEKAFGFKGENVEKCLDRIADRFSIPAFAQCLGPGVAVGALRASMGYPTVTADIDRLVSLLEETALAIPS